jgi:23S rRNA pseudouridine1911/1915/1917 synthase
VVIAVVIGREHDGERLDRALAVLTDTSRAEVARWIDAGRVRLGGRTVTKAAERVREGQNLEADPLPPPPSDARPDATVPFTVLHQDESLIVVDKPAGVVVHPAKGHWDGTLVNGLLALGPLPLDGDEPAARPGIVHRIDKDTSGVLVVARTPAAREALKQAFSRHDIERVYDAIAVGSVNDTTYDTFHERHPTDRKRFTGKRAGKRAVTHVRVVERFAAATRIECRLETGRTHQIRMHLAEAGAPLLADALYGKPPREPALRAIAEALGRQALHARVLGFVHPKTGKTMRFEAPWPTDFAAAVAALRAR